MPSPKSQRRATTGHEKNRKGRLSDRASSFTVERTAEAAEVPPRPRTVPNLFSGIRIEETTQVVYSRPKLTKLLVNVTIQRSLGAVKVIVPLEATVEELVGAALKQYVKEMRLPVLPSVDSSKFDLHYSQFALESLGREEKLMNLESRNFFLCLNATAAAVETVENSTSRCSKEATIRRGISWLKFKDFSV